MTFEGLIYIALIAMSYLIVSVAIAVIAVRYARKHSKNTKLWGLMAAFVLYNLIFWDWLPTEGMHKYYCSSEAGFWVYKSVDQWKDENPGEMGALSLPGTNVWPTNHNQFDGGHGETTTYLLSDRFNLVVTRQDVSTLLLIVRNGQEIWDIEKNEVLARYVDFESGGYLVSTPPGGPPPTSKFWLRNRNCSGDANAMLMYKFKERVIKELNK